MTTNRSAQAAQTFDPRAPHPAMELPVPVTDGGALPASFDPRRAVREDAIVCLLCGKAFRQLNNTHLKRHGLTTSAYKLRFGYNLRRPLMSLALRRLYAVRAIATNLAGHIRCRPVTIDPELRRRGGLRAITVEERFARREARARRGAAPSATRQNGATRASKRSAVVWRIDPRRAKTAGGKR